MGAGERWKERREALGKTLDEVSAELRISSRYLRGIEASDFNGWPARVFSIGFIRTYGRFLGEDAEPMIQEYLATAVEAPSNEHPRPVAIRPQWVERARERGNRMLMYVLAALCVLVIGGVLSWYSSRSVTEPVPSPPAAVPAAPPAGTENAVSASVPAADNSISAGTVLPKPAPPDNSAFVPAASASSPYQLYLEATEQAWLMYSMDESDPVDTMLYPGDKISIQARRKIVLKLGNAGGVVGTLNGKRMPPFGERGQVRVVTLGE